MLAHGDLEGTSPEQGATEEKAPSEIRITLTEPPTKGAEARAVDGCKDVVADDPTVDGNDIVLAVGPGERGRWKVSYRAVSAVDGHQTRDTFTFTVAGKKDCSPEEDPTEESPEPDDPADDDGTAAPPEDESSNAWLLWVGGGTVVVVALALVARRASA